MPGTSGDGVPEAVTLQTLQNAEPLSLFNGEESEDKSGSLKLDCRECKAVSKSPKICGGCWEVAYCSRPHQVKAWDKHQKDCKPWKVAKNAELGRYMIATRDIKAGELLLEDPFITLGPKTITEPVCLGCYRPVDGSYCCPKCGFPMCDEDCCSAENHVPECQAVSNSGVSVKVSVFGSENCMYECITPIRILALRDTDFRLWNKIQTLESHDEQRHLTEVAAITQTTVVDIIQNRLRLDEYDEDLINKVLGIIDINAFEIRLPDSAIMGVYGRAALLEHSCIPNTHRTFDADLNLVIRAAVDIKRGDHLQSCYTDSLTTTSDRQEHLLTSKFFTCSCRRCVDPTELGTYISCMLCPSCNKGPISAENRSNPSYGVVAPQDPQSSSTPWECLSCHNPIDTEYQNGITAVITDEAEELESGTSSIAACEAFIEKWSPTFHSNYAPFLNIKYMLMHLYGSEDGYTYDEMTPLHILSKEAICRQLLEVADVIVPGISRLRGSVLYELYQALFYKCQTLFKSGAITNDMAKKIAQEAYDHLLECARVLSYEPPVQPEGQLGLEAKDELKQMLNFIRKEGWK